MNEALTLHAPDETALLAIGARLSTALRPGLTIYLEGGLGMGKTTLTRGILQAMGVDGAVKSPTYTLVEPYDLPIGAVYHFDLYRLGDPEELEFMGVRDYFAPDSLCLVEWPGRGASILPRADLVITIDKEGAGRRLQLAAGSALGEGVLADLGDMPNDN